MLQWIQQSRTGIKYHTRVGYRYSDLLFHLLLAEGTANEVSRNPEGFARFDSGSTSAGIYSRGRLPALVSKSTSDVRLASFGLSRIIEPCNTLLLVPVACDSTDFAPLSFGSSVITGRPDDPPVSVFLFGSICTRMRLTSFCSLLITGSTVRKLGKSQGMWTSLQ